VDFFCRAEHKIVISDEENEAAWEALQGLYVAHGEATCNPELWKSILSCTSDKIGQGNLSPQEGSASLSRGRSILRALFAWVGSYTDGAWDVRREMLMCGRALLAAVGLQRAVRIIRVLMATMVGDVKGRMTQVRRDQLWQEIALDLSLRDAGLLVCVDISFGHNDPNPLGLCLAQRFSEL